MDSQEITPLPKAYYEKKRSREAWRRLPYPEKVRCVVALQKRIAPIYAARGIVIRPWTDLP
jgi:hypothetical protein